MRQECDSQQGIVASCSFRTTVLWHELMGSGFVGTDRHHAGDSARCVAEVGVPARRWQIGTAHRRDRAEQVQTVGYPPSPSRRHRGCKAFSKPITRRRSPKPDFLA